MRIQTEDLMGRVIIWGCVASTLLVSPWWTLDPINPIKALALSIAGFSLLMITVVNRRHIPLKNHRVTFCVSALFVIWMIVVFIFTSASKTQQLLGASGRNTGLITYASLAILLAGSAIVASEAMVKRFVWVAISIGALSGLYGFLQFSNLDPINWENSYSPVIGFLGNPNFQSSFLGLVCVMATAFLLNRKLSKSKQFTLLITILFLLFIIRVTYSQQGFLIFLIGNSVIGYLFIRSKQLKLLNVTYMVVALFGLILTVFGTLNKGPLASILYKPSVTYRGDYWRAGLNMTSEHPIFGVGLDSYGTWYRRSRTLEATLRRGPDIVTSAAHNVLLDLSSTGGFILLILYLVILGIVLQSIIRVLKRDTEFDVTFAAILGAWVSYQAQSIISINQIGLAIWGWVLSGLIIGYEINTRDLISEKSDPPRDRKILNSSLKKVSAATSLAMFGGILAGTIFGITPYYQSAKLKNALDSRNAQKIIAAAYLKPLNPAQMIQVASILNQNKLDMEALSVLEDLTKAFPDSYYGWRGIAGISTASPAQVTEAKAQMKRLDPHNPELK